MQSIEIWEEHVIHLNRDGQILLPNETREKKKQKRKTIPYPASQRRQQRYEDIKDNLLNDLEKSTTTFENQSMMDAKRVEENKQKKQEEAIAKRIASQKRHLQHMVQLFGCQMENPPYLRERKIKLMLPKRVNLKLPNMDYVSQSSIRWLDKDHLCLQHKVTLRIQIYNIPKSSLIKTFEPIIPKWMVDVVQCADHYMIQFDDQTLYGTSFFIQNKRLSTPRQEFMDTKSVTRERLHLYSDPQMEGHKASSIHGLSSGFLIAYGEELQFVDICHWNTMCIHDMRYDSEVEQIVSHKDTVVFTSNYHPSAIAVMHGPVFSPLSPIKLPVTWVDSLSLADDAQLYVMADAGTEFLHVCLNTGSIQSFDLQHTSPCRSLTLAGNFGVFRSQKHTILQALPRASTFFFDVHLPKPQRLPNWDDDHATILGYENCLLLIDQAPLISVANALPLDDVFVHFEV